MDKSKQAQYEARKRTQNKEKGLVECRVWVLPKHTQRVREYVKSLNEGKV